MGDGLKILVVDDEKHITDISSHCLRSAGWEVVTAATAEEGLDKLQADPSLAIVFMDLRLPGMSGLEALKAIRQKHSPVEVVMITAQGTLEGAVEAMQEGAADYIQKPFEKSRLLASVDRLLKVKNLEAEVRRLRQELQGRYEFTNIVGQSPPMKRLFEIMSSAAQNDATVLVLGESGTGKELVAKGIHYNGLRSKGPFIAVNCAALPGELIESELFGYKKGSFTGAVRDSVGLFKAASGGTLFLDEVLEMPSATQPKLLRALQEKKIRAVGGTDEVEVDVRLIAATNRDVQSALKQGSIREDLYYRLSVIPVTVPALRERREDIPLLVEFFVTRFGKENRRGVKGVDKSALEVLLRYGWPGNVRELENVLESACVLCKGESIQKGDLPAQILKEVESGLDPALSESGGVTTLAESEKRLLEAAMKAVEGNKSKAAKALGVSRKKLYKMISKYCPHLA